MSDDTPKSAAKVCHSVDCLYNTHGKVVEDLTEGIKSSEDKHLRKSVPVSNASTADISEQKNANREETVKVREKRSKSEAGISDVTARVATKKPVYKKEFIEKNFYYYDETLTLFYLGDFLANKKLSHGVLNDQTRTLRANSDSRVRRKRLKGDPELKAKIREVLMASKVNRKYGPAKEGAA